MAWFAENINFYFGSLIHVGMRATQSSWIHRIISIKTSALFTKTTFFFIRCLASKISFYLRNKVPYFRRFFGQRKNHFTNWWFAFIFLQHLSFVTQKRISIHSFGLTSFCRQKMHARRETQDVAIIKLRFTVCVCAWDQVRIRGAVRMQLHNKFRFIPKCSSNSLNLKKETSEKSTHTQPYPNFLAFMRSSKQRRRNLSLVCYKRRKRC